MQALTIWHSCLIPQLNLELYSSRSSVKWVEKRGFKSGTGVIGTKNEFNGKLYCLCSKGTINLLFKPRNSLGAAFALTWALAEPEVGIGVEFTHAQLGNNQEDNNDARKSRIDEGEKARNGNSERVDVRALAFKLHSAKTADDVEEVLKGKQKLPLQVFSTIIRGFGKEKRLDSAKKWWAALEVYEDLLDKGPKPNNASETAAAIEIFKRMVENGEKPTIISYGALLSALEKGKLYDEALRVWKHMVKVGVEPNLYAYTIMSSIYAGQGKFDIVDSIIREMVTVGVDPTVVTFNAIISSCARNSMGSVAYEWFERMKVQNVTPNEVTYEMLIEALANDGKPRIGYELYLRALNEGLELSARAYDAVVRSSETYGATIDVGALGPRPPEKKKKVQVQARKNMSEFCKLADVPRRSKTFERSEIYMSQSEELHS
ncbi:pentatricopeptide repeat-containing protein at3g46610 [Phtheirospermum japonicum]|uniref:Pentatricopeptide repeat-containing protein at3g46610 n=1 Tax=Phtheirospermum japonicum TaxID=374723 RepID=A0A830BCY3_9LAMI|nr:pentatricopeptide repeat-containing protein at3g46610 [Phtheirospermum japonicum]